ncbi:MAG TPA: protein-disulfide reductase DsbD domain-containing protein [Gemmatimonadaceae bacterium]
MRILGLLALSAAIGCTAQKDQAPAAPTGPVVEWAAIASAPRPGPENSMLVDVDLQVTVLGGWFVYSLTQTTGGPTPMTVTVAAPYTIAGEIVAPPPEKAQDANFGIETEKYSGEKIFKIPLRLAASSSLNPPPVELKVRSQACSNRLCLPARTTTLMVTPEAAL